METVNGTPLERRRTGVPGEPSQVGRLLDPIVLLDQIGLGGPGIIRI